MSCWGHHSSVGCPHDPNHSPRQWSATAPFQYDLTPKSGAECIAHTHSRLLTDLDDRAIVLSIDGMVAFDLISGCNEGPRSVDGAVRHSLLSCSSTGTLRHICGPMTVVSLKQGVMCALGQHQELRSVQSPRRRSVSFRVSQFERVGDIHNLLRDELWHHSRIHIRGWQASWSCRIA